MLSMSRVDRASRSSLVTINAPPSARAAIAFFNCVRSLFAPLTFTLNILAALQSQAGQSEHASSVYPSALNSVDYTRIDEKCAPIFA
jgi:hypothetical protein